MTYKKAFEFCYNVNADGARRLVQKALLSGESVEDYSTVVGRVLPSESISPDDDYWGVLLIHRTKGLTLMFNGVCQSVETRVVYHQPDSASVEIDAAQKAHQCSLHDKPMLWICTGYV